MTTSLLLCAAILGGGADTWPGFRGTGNSVSVAARLPLKWDTETGVLWRTDLPGYGQSSPVIWQSRVFVTTAIGDQKQTAAVIATDLNSGKILWKKEIAASVPAKVSNYISRAAPTPAVDARRVYAFFEMGNLLAIDHQGKVLWQRSLTDDYGSIKGNHGVGSSIALTEKSVIVLVDHDGPSYLLAVDKATGKTLWKTDRPAKVSWSSPIVESDGEQTQIVVSSNGTCEAIDAANGKQLWIVSGLDGNTVPSATIHDDLVIVASSAVGENLAIRRGGQGDVSDSHVLWRSRKATASFGSALVYQGHTYMVSRSGIAHCLNTKTGETVWTRRVGDSCWASPLGAAGRVYFFGKGGKTTVVAAGEKLNVLAENSLPTDDRVYGIAAVDGKLVVRSGRQLTCLATGGDAPVQKAATTKQTPAQLKPNDSLSVKKRTSQATETDNATKNDDATDNSAKVGQLTNLPLAITSFGAAKIGDAIYVYGGHHGRAHHYSQAGQSADLIRLGGKKNSKWEVVSRGPRLQGLALVAHGGKLYRIGGFAARNKEGEDHDLWSVDDFARFDPATKKWVALPSLPGARSSFDAVVVGDTVYVIGGWAMQGEKPTEWHTAALAFDLTRPQGDWRTIAAPKFKRRALSTATQNGLVVAIGGMQPDGEPTQRTALYDPAKDAWSEGPKLPGGAMEGFGSAAFNIDGRLCVSTASGTLLRLSDDFKMWEKIAQVSPGRFFHRLLPLGDSKAALIGGASMEQGRFSTIDVVEFGKPNGASNK